MVAMFAPLAGWMNFPTLDGLQGVRGVYAIAWRFTDQSDETWTARINQFKNNKQEALAGAGRTLYKALPGLFQANGWQPSETAMTVALSSADTQLVPTKPYPRIIEFIAPKLGATWLPNLLTKNPHKPLHTCGSQAEREAELEKANYQAAPISGATKRIIVCDDIATRGDTFSKIAEAIKETSPSIEVVGLALGKSERVSYAASRGYEISNAHVSGWEATWTTG